MRVFERVMGMVVGFGIIGVFATSASAEECETDADCGPGYVCTTYEYSDPGCADIDMPDCPADDPTCMEEKIPECDTEPGEVYVESYCERAPCESDDDCGDEMICIEFTEEWCDSSGWCDETGCYEEEPECGSDTFSECGYAYEGSCEVDADCGEGFSCVAEEMCWCSAGDTDSVEDVDVAQDPDVSGLVAVDTDGAEDIPDEDCGCEPTGEYYCQLQELPCESDDDCPAGMTCAEGYSDIGVSCVEYEDGIVECDTDVSEGPSMCRPTGWDDDVIREDNDGDIDSGSDSDVDIDADIDTDGSDGDEEGDGDGDIFDDINIGIFFSGCSVSAPAKTNPGFGVIDMLSLI